MSVSNCCYAPMSNPDVCSRCKEHCAPLSACDHCEEYYDGDDLTLIAGSDLWLCAECLENRAEGGITQEEENRINRILFNRQNPV